MIAPAISPCSACNGSGYNSNGVCPVCNGVGRIDDGSVEFAIASAISKIALQARRNGATGDRRWPSLSSLNLAGSWVAIGEMYVPEILKEIGLRAVKVAAR